MVQHSKLKCKSHLSSRRELSYYKKKKMLGQIIVLKYRPCLEEAIFLKVSASRAKQEGG